MNFKALGSITGIVLFVTACSSNVPSSPPGTGVAARRSLGCYGDFAVKVKPCPARLTTKNGGNATVSVSGKGVALAVIIGNDCAGSGAKCNIVQTGYTQFDTYSVPGENPCGTAYVVFEGLTASESPIGTATLKVVNKYC
jgi:hypothetical protein